jgi:SRSO17 transposase
MAKLRRRVDRDYQEMKQEIGLDHYEGRMWRGFHHPATLCAVAHGFLALRPSMRASTFLRSAGALASIAPSSMQAE